MLDEFERELRVDIYTPATPTYHCSMRVTHMPTGQVVEGETTKTEPFQMRLRDRLYLELRKKVEEYNAKENSDSGKRTNSTFADCGGLQVPASGFTTDLPPDTTIEDIRELLHGSDSNPTQSSVCEGLQ